MSLKFPELSTYQYSCTDPSKRFPVENPATGEIITTIQAGDDATTKAAIEASKKAFDTTWRWTSPQERSQLLFKCASALEPHREELAHLLCMENGKPYQDSLMFDINFVISIFRYFASLVDKLPSEFYDRGPLYTSVLYEPYGVCAGILPFNWPPIHTGGKLAPALAAGNTMILKPGEQAPLTCIRIIELLTPVLPPNVVQFVPGLGPEVPQALVTSPDVHCVSFTGSTRAGGAVAASAAKSITPLTLELGGKNAIVVFEDADLERALKDALEGGFFNKGEACTATSRLLVHESIHDKFVERLGTAVKKLRAGNGEDKGTHVGPVVSKVQQEKVMAYIKKGQDEGARVVAQGSVTEDPKCKHGYFVPPTLFAGVKPGMTITKEEMFGPIVTVMPFSTEVEAVEELNSSEYGLTAVVFTKDMERALRVSRRVDVGMVWINQYWRNLLGTPFGGAKESGYGREHCIETLHEWSRAKTINMPSGMGSVPSWRGAVECFAGENL